MVLITVALAGCQTDLYTRQTEADANEMLGALLDARLDASKKSLDGGKTWNVLVEESQMARAVGLLKAAGLPSQRYASLGDLFKKDGLISTPTEERVRFIYGVSQELSNSLAQIDGVLVARVHVVLPNNDPLAARVEPASASVFVKHRATINTATLVPTIKNFVMRGVQGLAAENVSVTLIQAVGPAPASDLSPMVQVVPTLGQRISTWALAPGLLAAGLAAAVVVRRRRGKAAEQANDLPASPAAGAAVAVDIPVATSSHLTHLGRSAINAVVSLLKRRSA
jgi:type III secretion protein J